MSDASRLRDRLQHIDGRSYPAYRDIKGRWVFDEITLFIDHVQGDPFAAPSRLRVQVSTGIPDALLDSPDKRLAVEDWLLRRFGQVLNGERRGSGRSGALQVYRPGPEIVERSAARLIGGDRIELRFTAGLPARGRRVLGRQAWEMLSEDIPKAADGLFVEDHPDLRHHVHSVQTQRSLRRQLQARSLIAFIANDSVLPRASGVSQSPLAGAIPFVSPPSLQITLDSFEGPITGMGIPSGLTLIVGGGFHGKSTLLLAIQRGFLDHVPGDGRERVGSTVDVVKVRAEDGRRVEAVDISPFLNGLPGGKSTRPFSTEDASGSTSQAAAIIEAIEAGARALLIDEDTSATNLLVRDARMRALIPAPQEPITPFVERVRELYDRWGVSTVMVIGGVGDYLAVADRVIGMNAYRATELTTAAKAIAGPAPVPETPLPDEMNIRTVVTRSLLPTGKGRVRARDERRVDYGAEEIDLRAVEQVLDGAHSASIGHAVRWIAEMCEGRLPLDVLLDTLEEEMDASGVEVLSSSAFPAGGLVRPRRHEVSAALNRLRTLRVR